MAFESIYTFQASWTGLLYIDSNREDCLHFMSTLLYVLLLSTMARPTTKQQLLDLSLQNYNRIIDLIDGLPPEVQEATFAEGTLNKNIRDVLYHVHHWHTLFLTWEATAAKGVKPDMPAPGYTWRNVPQLNKLINQTYETKSLADARAALEQSFSDVRNIINKHTDTELYTKKNYFWTGSTHLASYLISATSSHYDWAYKLIKRKV